ncbi:MAG: glycosyltransferase family 4 protein [Balneola sp.]
MKTESQIKVLVIQKGFSNYRKSIFDKLNNRYNFKLLHSYSKLGIKEIKTEYSTEIGKIKYAKKETAVYLNVFSEVAKFQPDVIIHEFTPSILSLFPLILLRKYLGFKLILWGHGFNKKRGFGKKGFIFRVRKWYINMADAVVFYSNNNKDIIKKLFPSDKYFVANNSLDTETFAKINDGFIKKGKSAIKNDLGIAYNHVVLFIGRLLENKILPEYFTEVIQKISSEKDGIGVYIIGEGPSKETLKVQLNSKNLNNVHFLGAIYDEQVNSKYLFVSDILLMPGYVGLAVNHALSFSCPIVTFEEGKEGPYHSPEIEYLQNHKTGYRAKNMDTEDMSNFIIEYLNDLSLQNTMEVEMKRMVEEKCSIGHMEEGFRSAIKYCLNR